MEVDKIIKFALVLAIGYAACGELGSATAALSKKTLNAIQHKQLSYAKFNRMLQKRR